MCACVCIRVSTRYRRLPYILYSEQKFSPYATPYMYVYNIIQHTIKSLRPVEEVFFFFFNCYFCFTEKRIDNKYLKQHYIDQLVFVCHSSIDPHKYTSQFAVFRSAAYYIVGRFHFSLRFIRQTKTSD